MWGGRFSEPTDEFVQTMTASVGFDRRLADADIDGSIAHAKMLHRAGVLDDAELQSIEDGLARIREEIGNGQFAWSVALEDVHMNIEARLTELIGDAGKKLHTGRSRNDQVATDIRLYLRDAHRPVVAACIRSLQQALLDLAEREADTVMPGFTHLQVAQPVTFGHHLLAWFEMLARDATGSPTAASAVNRMPLGAAALAGTSYPHRPRLYRRAARLRPARARTRWTRSPTATSPSSSAPRPRSAHDAPVAHVRGTGAVVVRAVRLHRPADRFCTGSSIMPQKKNPDVPELVRGKTGRVNGHLVALLTLMKASRWPTTRTTRKTRNRCSTRSTR